MSEREVELLGYMPLGPDGKALMVGLHTVAEKVNALIAAHNRLAERVEGQGEELEAVRARLRMIEEWRTAPPHDNTGAGSVQPGVTRRWLDLDRNDLLHHLDLAVSDWWTKVLGYRGDFSGWFECKAALDDAIIDALRTLAAEGPGWPYTYRDGREAGKAEALAALESNELWRQLVNGVLDAWVAGKAGDTINTLATSDSIIAAVRRAIEGGGK